MVGKQEVWEMGTTRLEAVDGTEVGSGAAGIGAVTSPISCLLDSSMHTTGKSGLYGR